MTVSVDGGVRAAAARHAQQLIEHAADALATALPAARALDDEAQGQSAAATEFRRAADELAHSVSRAQGEAVLAGQHCAALARWLVTWVDGVW